MVLKNIIINKSSLIHDSSELILDDNITDKIKKIVELTKKIQTFESTTNYEEIKNLDLYNQILKNKICLYQPVEYNGWLTLFDFVKYRVNVDKLSVYVDSDLFGIIELLKYMREVDDKYYISRSTAENIPSKGFEYLKKMFNVEIMSDLDSDNTSIDNTAKFDLIILTDYSKIKLYQSFLTKTGSIVLVTQFSDINKDLILTINSGLKIFDHVELISPIILKQTGEFVVIFQKPTDYYEIKTDNYIGNLMMKVNNFFDFHLHRLNAVIKSKLHILEISNSDLQLKLISVYKTKLRSKIINLMTIFNIPVNTKLLDYYDNKLQTINNKLYSSVNLISYQFIKYEDIELNINLDQKNLISYPNLHAISKNLNRVKRAIDTRYFKKWQYITFQLDNYKSLGEYIAKNYKVVSKANTKPSNAFMKMYEMAMTFKIIDKSNPTLKSFHFCEAPGMFIIGLNHYLQTKTNIKNWDFYGNSLTIDADKTALTDVYGLIDKYKNKWLIGPKASGDIRELTNIDFFKEKLTEVDLITSDCGICVDLGDLNKYEELIAETDFAQFINMLNLLKKGGSGIIKTFIPLELPSNVCLIYTLTQVFEEVYFSKPITSRPQNSEVYLVCIGYLGIDPKSLDKLKSLLNKKLYPKFNPKLNWIDNIPESFVKQLEDYVVEITRQQISYLLNIFHFVDNTSELEKIKILRDDNKLKEITNKYWCKKFDLEINNKQMII
jgi:23S rRNA U2552 (ribose-2'-O)-methylase RlmE/FtsJ